MIVNSRKYSSLQKVFTNPFKLGQKITGEECYPIQFHNSRQKCTPRNSDWLRVVHSVLFGTNYAFISEYSTKISIFSKHLRAETNNYMYLICLQNRKTYGKCYNFLHTNHLIFRRFSCFMFICHQDVNCTIILHKTAYSNQVFLCVI